MDSQFIQLYSRCMVRNFVLIFCSDRVFCDNLQFIKSTLNQDIFTKLPSFYNTFIEPHHNTKLNLLKATAIQLTTRLDGSCFRYLDYSINYDNFSSTESKVNSNLFYHHSLRFIRASIINLSSLFGLGLLSNVCSCISAVYAQHA